MMNLKMKDAVDIFLTLARKEFGEAAVVQGKILHEFAIKNNIQYPYSWLRANAAVDRGQFS